MSVRIPLIAPLLLLSWLLPIAAKADEDLFAMSIEELMRVPISLASRREQALVDTPAAVTVLSADDIRHSGLTSLPEILRLIPGISVTRFDANKWGISIRGFHNRFANKLLVLMDGRTLYTPLFSGTYWDAHDVVLEDIERIEVIRGPGGSLWGANAVNGVINIVTKSARKTKGTLLDVAVGDQDTRLLASARYGFDIANFSARVYAMQREMDSGEITGLESGNNNFRVVGSDAFDNWHKTQMGARIDNDCQPFCINASFDIYRGDLGQTRIARPGPGQPIAGLDDMISISGHDVVTRLSDSVASLPWQVQLVVDHTEREDAALMHELDQIELDTQQSWYSGERNSNVLTYGANYRQYHDNAVGKTAFILTPARGDESSYSAFVQYEFALAEAWSTTLGNKWEKVSERDSASMPTARLRWRVNDQHMLWAAYSKAIRTPSRSERESAVRVGAVLIPTGNPELDNETLNVSEIGYRGQVIKNINIDLNLFEHRYDELSVQNLNQGSLTLRGYEWVMHWQLRQSLSLTLQHSRRSGKNANHSTLETASNPESSSHLRLAYQFSNDWDLSFLAYKSSVVRTSNSGFDYGDIDRQDLVVSWRPIAALKLSASYLNLNKAVHIEDFDPQRLSSGIERALLLRAIYSF